MGEVKGIRKSPGRKSNEIRDVKIVKNYMKFAEGSCLITMGETKVICTASVEEGVPPFLKGSGTGWVTAEYGMLPRSCGQRTQREVVRGRPGGRTHEIQRLIGRSMRTVCDLSKLGERTIRLDCDVVQADGGTRCASITGSFIALCLALDRMKRDGLLQEMPISDYVAAVSVGIVGGKPVLDLDYGMDSRAEVDMNVVMTCSGTFIEVQGTAEREPFSKEKMDRMLDLAEKGIKKLIALEKKILRGIPI